MSNGEYAKYVKDADIESYLQGLLWVVRMYRAGVCPDVSYSYHSRYRSNAKPHFSAHLS